MGAMERAKGTLEGILRTTKLATETGRIHPTDQLDGRGTVAGSFARITCELRSDTSRSAAKQQLQRRTCLFWRDRLVAGPLERDCCVATFK